MAQVGDPVVFQLSSALYARIGGKSKRMTTNQSINTVTDTSWHLLTEMNRYSSFVRIGTGLSFADYIWIRQKPWKSWDPKKPPSFLLTSRRGQDDKGDVYLEPEE
jgi:hypothetical protein